MPIPLGILAVAGVRAAGSYDLLETTVVGSTSVSSVTFSNLNTYASTYQHLQIRIATSSAPSRFGLQFNGVSSLGSYAFHYLYANNSLSSPVSGGSSGGSSFTGAITCGIGTTSPSAAVIDILDPFESKNKTVRSLSGYNLELALWSGVWLNTNSTTSITVLGVESPTRNFATGSRFSLYGLKAS